MRLDTILRYFAFIFVGLFSTGLALWSSTAFLQSARTQEEEPLILPEPPRPNTSPADVNSDQSPDSLEMRREKLRVDVQGFLEPFIYDPKDRRNPFQPYSEAPAVEESELSGPVMPLQRFDLDQLKLIGIIWGVHEPKAMFLDPNARVYTVGRDERIGRNNGYIATIREGEVVVVEAIRRREGEVLYSPRVLRIER